MPLFDSSRYSPMRTPPPIAAAPCDIARSRNALPAPVPDAMPCSAELIMAAGIVLELCGMAMT